MDESIQESAEQNNTRRFGDCGLIVPMQKLNKRTTAGAAHNMINCGMAMSAAARSRDAAMDEGRMREIFEFTRARANV